MTGILDPAAIDEATISERLYTAGMPDPDLLIRTAGEMRVSNYLALADLLRRAVGDARVLAGLHDGSVSQCALRDYAARERRFGGLNPPPA